MKFEPRIKVTFYDVDKPESGSSFTCASDTMTVDHTQLWLGGKLIARYNSKNGHWFLTNDVRPKFTTACWPSFKVEVLP